MAVIILENGDTDKVSFASVCVEEAFSILAQCGWFCSIEDHETVKLLFKDREGVGYDKERGFGAL
jgi:hypothetical protein